MVPFSSGLYSAADEQTPSSFPADDRCSDTVTPTLKPQHVDRPLDAIIPPYPTCTHQTRLPATCFLRSSYDRLHASLSEVIMHQSGADVASNKVILPSKESMNLFVESYFENFSPLFPILSSVEFVADMEHYLLVFCVCTIGVSFLADKGLQTLYAMRSLLRKNLDRIVRITDHVISYHVCMWES